MERTVIYASLQDGTIRSDSGTPTLPLGNTSSQTDQQSTLSATKSQRPLFRITPANKMTVRRDPPKDRLMGLEDSNGISIRVVQAELNRSERQNEVPEAAPILADQNGWTFDDPYGKYLYIHHAPLLFEDIPAERYGEVCEPHLQPVVSFAKFMGTVPLLPYKITTNYYAAHHEEGWSAFDHHGNLRPGILEGSYFPNSEVISQYPKANLAGGLAEAGTITGLIFLLP